jgi:hypothetical protein
MDTEFCGKAIVRPNCAGRKNSQMAYDSNNFAANSSRAPPDTTQGAAGRPIRGVRTGGAKPTNCVSTLLPKLVIHKLPLASTAIA